MHSDLKAAGLPLAYGSEMYIVQIAYEDINLMDLKAASLHQLRVQKCTLCKYKWTLYYFENCSSIYLPNAF